MSANHNQPNRFNESFSNLMKEIDGFFNDSSKNFHSFFNRRPFEVQTYERREAFVVVAQLPGIRRKQIEIELVRNQLRIAVDQEAVEQESKKEVSRERMERWINLPFEADKKDVTAEYRDGILKISIPKDNANRNFIDIE